MARTGYKRPGQSGQANFGILTLNEISRPVMTLSASCFGTFEVYFHQRRWALARGRARAWGQLPVPSRGSTQLELSLPNLGADAA